MRHRTSVNFLADGLKRTCLPLGVQRKNGELGRGWIKLPSTKHMKNIRGRNHIFTSFVINQIDLMVLMLDDRRESSLDLVGSSRKAEVVSRY